MEFRTTIVTDLVRVLPARVQVAMLSEFARISRRVVAICAVRDTPHSTWIGRPAYREAAGWSLVPIEALRALAREHGVPLRAIYRSHYVAVLEHLCEHHHGQRAP
jgi:hypothetical protein